MKAGPCGTVFVAWEACVDTHREAGGDFVESCLPQTRGLKECMEANPEYYGPLLERDGDDKDDKDDNQEEEEAGAAAAEEAAPQAAGAGAEAAAPGARAPEEAAPAAAAAAR